MLNYTTLQNFLQFARMFLDVAIISLFLYFCLRYVRNNSRTIQIFKGILFILFVNAFAKALGLKTTSWVAEMFLNWGFLAAIIIFQPEIRTVLEKLGKTSVFSRISTLSGNEREYLVDELVKATMILSEGETGALITIEQGQSLSDYIRTGTPMNSVVTAELLTSIFVTSTPLHDGAVIIQGDRIACASAYFPPTALDLPTRYGARHRAALGISEITDAITIVVSEETGLVSISHEGKLESMTATKLKEFLMRVICDTETEVKSRKTVQSASEKRLMTIQQEIIEEKKKQSDVPLIREETPVTPTPAPKVQKEEKEKKGLFGGIFKKKKKETEVVKVNVIRGEQTANPGNQNQSNSNQVNQTYNSDPTNYGKGNGER